MPVSTSTDHGDRGPRHAESLREFTVSSNSTTGEYFGHSPLGQLRQRVAFASLRSPVANLVRGVLCGGCPPEVTGIDARGIPAKVRGLVFLRWGQAMRQLADNAVCSPMSALVIEFAIALTGLRERPDYTIDSFGCDHPKREGKQSSHRSLLGRAERGRFDGPFLWGAIPRPETVVGLAPSACMNGLAALCNRAYQVCSHSTVLSSFRLEPVAARQRSAGSPFVPSRRNAGNSGSRT